MNGGRISAPTQIEAGAKVMIGKEELLIASAGYDAATDRVD